MTPRHALWLPLFDDLSDPRLVARIAAEAEEAGWDGLFVVDHVRWREPVTHVADPWITLTAIACATERLRFGPMVSAIARRRPVKLARETASLDRLGGGRLALGVGLGSDWFAGEFSRTGEECDDRVRGRCWTSRWRCCGQGVVRRGRAPSRRALHSGRCAVPASAFRECRCGRPASPANSGRCAGPPVGRVLPRQPVVAGEFADAVARVEALRTDDGPFDYAVRSRPARTPRPYVEAGATWLLAAFDPASLSVDHVRGVLRDGPA